MRMVFTELPLSFTRLKMINKIIVRLQRNPKFLTIVETFTFSQN